MAEQPTPCELVIGGTNQVTRYLLPGLLETSLRPITVVSRQPRPNWCPPTSTITWQSGGIESFAQTPVVAANLFYLAPLPLFDALPERLAAQRVIAISSTSIHTKAESASAAERRVAQALTGGENAVTTRCRSLEIPCTILRPTLIYGCGMDRNLSTVAAWVRRYGFLVVPRACQGLRQPVHAQDVAFAVNQAARRGAAEDKTYVLSGGSTLTYESMLRLVFQALGRRSRLVRLPAGLMKGLIRMARLLPQLNHLDPAMIDRFSEDLVFSHEAAQVDLDFSPRKFSPDAGCFPEQ